MKPLLDVKSFGAIAAEDDNVKKYFVQTPVFREVSSGDKRVVIGRKGAGKTALYLALLDRGQGSDSLAEGLTFKDYPWAVHAKYAYEETTRQERFVSSWRFLMLLGILKKLLSDPSRAKRGYGKAARDALEGVETFVTKNWGVASFDYRKTFPTGGLSIDGVSIAPSVMGNSLGGMSVNKKGGGMGETLPRLNEWLWSALVAVGEAAPAVTLLFDELDAGFATTNEDYKDRIVGLLLSVRALAKDVAKQGLPHRVVAFLRTDIYDTLQFGDKNKLTEHDATYLAWNGALSYEGASVKELIDQRIREELALPRNNASPWGAAFDSDVMRGTQHKFLHMIARSFLRPRDLIKFCNCALDEYKRRVRTGDRRALISNDDVRNSRTAYSQYFVNELDDEVAAAHPKWKDHLEVLRGIGQTKFTREMFAVAYRKVAKRSQLDLDEGATLEMFYRYSIVGFERAVGGAGLVQQFRYEDERVKFDADSSQFMVHRGLKESLELRDIGDASRDDG